MPRPTWLAYGLAMVMFGVSFYCIARLVAARWWDRRNHLDVSVAHGVMGVSMAGMLAPRLNVLPRGLGEAVFIGLALWFSWGTGHALFTGSGGHAPSHYAVHLVMALAMIYMYAVALPTTAGSGLRTMGPPTGTAADFVVVPLVFVVVLLASAVWQLDALSKYAPRPRALVVVRSGASAFGADEDTSSAWLAPRLEMGCHIATCIVMAYVLVLLL